MPLAKDRIATTLDILRGYASLCRQHGVVPVVVGTEALRRAPNKRDFLDPAEEILGGPVDVIDGAREAELNFQATRGSFPEQIDNGPCLTFDIGGGSTEFVFSAHGCMGFHTSLPLGAVRLTEAFVAQTPPPLAEEQRLRAHIKEQLADVASRPELAELATQGTVIGTAGTVTTLAAMERKLETYDPTVIHGMTLTRDALGRQLNVLRLASDGQRDRLAGLDPKRGPVIFAGAVLLDEILP